MMGSTYPQPILPDSARHIFRAVSDLLSDADITVGNLEGTIGEGGTTRKKLSKRTYAFRMPKGYVNILKNAGFDLLALANNHINDFGLAGMQSTMNLLDLVGISYSGPEGEIAYLQLNDFKVAFIAFGFSPNCYSIFDIERAQQEVAGLKQAGNIVIVSFHGGSEGRRSLHTKDELEYLFSEPRGNVVKFARSVIDSGADLVIGHGPHVPRAIELYKKRLIAYSLGNFCTYGYFNLDRECGLSLILDVELDRTGKFIAGRILPVYQQKPGIPLPDSLGRTIELIKSLSVQDFSNSCPDIKDDGSIFPPWVNE